MYKLLKQTLKLNGKDFYLDKEYSLDELGVEGRTLDRLIRGRYIAEVKNAKIQSYDIPKQQEVMEPIEEKPFIKEPKKNGGKM